MTPTHEIPSTRDEHIVGTATDSARTPANRKLEPVDSRLVEYSGTAAIPTAHDAATPRGELA